MADKPKDEATTPEKSEVQTERERRQKAEKTRIRRMLTKHGIDAEILRGVDRLIVRAAFYAVTLEDLEEQINREGCESRYKNGEHQWGTKQSPAVMTQAAFAQRFFSVMKQITDLLPETDSKKPPEDELMGYIGRK